MTFRLLEAYRSDIEAEGLMRESIVNRIKIDEGKLFEFLRRDDKYGLAFALPCLTPVEYYVGSGTAVRKLVLVLAEEFQRQIVVVSWHAVPRCAVDTSVSEILVRVLTE